MKIAVISCSPNIDYIRAKTLRTGFSAVKDAEVIILKNQKVGLVRYFEVIIKLLKLKINQNPDIFVVTFRGYEILPFVLLISGNKKVIYDEFINPIEWLVYEHHKVSPDNILLKIFIRFYKFLVSRCDYILTDTIPHAEYSASLNDVNIYKYISIPVGTDESLFRPTNIKKQSRKKFKVFYYGQNMTPLHGLSYVLEAAVKLSKISDIEFVIVGGTKETLSEIQKATVKGANIKYIKWVDFNKLPNEIIKSDLCLGGPFGSTIQSQLVITGKTFQFLACSVPVVIGRTKINNIFKDEKNCLLVNQGNSLQLSNKILWAFNNQKSLKNISKNGRKTYLEYFSNNIIINKTQNLIDNI